MVAQTSGATTGDRRRFVKFGQDTPSPICEEIVARIAQLYAIEKDIRGKAPDTRKAERQTLSKPIVDALRPWLEARLQELPSASDLARHIRYGLKRWDGLTRFLADGRVEMDTNGVENAIRPNPLTRKNALFAESDDGARTMFARTHGAKWRALGAHRIAHRHGQAQWREPGSLHRRHASQDPRPAHVARYRGSHALDLRRIVNPHRDG